MPPSARDPATAPRGVSPGGSARAAGPARRPGPAGTTRRRQRHRGRPPRRVSSCQEGTDVLRDEGQGRVQATRRLASPPWTVRSVESLLHGVAPVASTSTPRWLGWPRVRWPGRTTSASPGSTPTARVRTGDPEVVYAAGKTPGADGRDPARARGASPAAGLRSPPGARRGDPGRRRAALPRRAGRRRSRARSRSARCRTPRGTVCVVAAGTSDAPVAAEAALRGAGLRRRGRRVDDVGVAGLHRLLAVARRSSTRPTAWSSSPAWRARCRAWSAG